MPRAPTRKGRCSRRRCSSSTPPCAAGTVVSFWAHYDDDLIFANPALQEAFDNGQCLRTSSSRAWTPVKASLYASNREPASAAPTTPSAGSPACGPIRTVQLRNGVTVTLAAHRRRQGLADLPRSPRRGPPGSGCCLRWESFPSWSRATSLRCRHAGRAGTPVTGPAADDGHRAREQLRCD